MGLGVYKFPHVCLAREDSHSQKILDVENKFRE